MVHKDEQFDEDRLLNNSTESLFNQDLPLQPNVAFEGNIGEMEHETTMEHYIRGDIDVLMAEAHSLLFNGSIDSMFLDDDANDVVVGATKEIKTEHPELPSIEVESNQSMAENSIEPQTSPADNLQLQEEEFQGVFKSLRSRSVLYRELCGESLGDRTIDKGDEDIVVVGDQVETIANPADAGPLIMFPYSCGHCHLIFQYLSLLDDHLKVHRASQVAPKSTSTYACNLCAFATDEKGRIKKHVLRKH